MRQRVNREDHSCVVRENSEGRGPGMAQDAVAMETPALSIQPPISACGFSLRTVSGGPSVAPQLRVFPGMASRAEEERSATLAAAASLQLGGHQWVTRPHPGPVTAPNVSSGPECPRSRGCSRDCPGGAVCGEEGGCFRGTPAASVAPYKSKAELAALTGRQEPALDSVELVTCAV